MARENEPMSERPVRELSLQRPGKRTKAGFIMLLGVAIIGLLDTVLLVLMFTMGHAFVGIHDELAAIILLSVPLVIVLLGSGAFLGALDWYAARKAARRPGLLTVAATCLNVVLLAMVLIVGLFLWTFDPMPPT